MARREDMVGPVLAYLEETTGLIFPPSRASFIEQIVSDAMRKAKATRTAAFLNFLAAHPAVEEALIADLTVGETYFFRHPEQLDVIRGMIIPSIVAARSPELPIRVWSAGCATGEEAYTLAILFDQMNLAERVRVLGTDLSQARLRVAMKARYRPWSFRDLPPDIMAAYFTPSGDGYQLDASIKSRVDFRHLNLVAGVGPVAPADTSEMDLILCRNVLMYFAEDVIVRVAQRLIDSLAEGGWLVLGAPQNSETSNPAAAGKTDAKQR